MVESGTPLGFESLPAFGLEPESSGRAAPQFVYLASHPVRWRLMTELANSDYRVRELVKLVGIAGLQTSLDAGSKANPSFSRNWANVCC